MRDIEEKRIEKKEKENKWKRKRKNTKHFSAPFENSIRPFESEQFYDTTVNLQSINLFVLSKWNSKS